MSRIVSVFILCMASISLARILSKCELVHELRKHGFPEYQMRDWVCLVSKESSFQTDLRQGPDPSGYYRWGIFQISDGWWCNVKGAINKGCNVYCNDLLTDNITASAICAKHIMNYQGLAAWGAWLNHCKDKWQPDLNCDCNCDCANNSEQLDKQVTKSGI